MNEAFTAARTHTRRGARAPAIARNLTDVITFQFTNSRAALPERNSITMAEWSISSYNMSTLIYDCLHEHPFAGSPLGEAHRLEANSARFTPALALGASEVTDRVRPGVSGLTCAAESSVHPRVPAWTSSPLSRVISPR